MRGYGFHDARDSDLHRHHRADHGTHAQLSGTHRAAESRCARRRERARVKTGRVTHDRPRVCRCGGPSGPAASPRGPRARWRCGGGAGSRRSLAPAARLWSFENINNNDYNIYIYTRLYNAAPGAGADRVTRAKRVAFAARARRAAARGRKNTAPLRTVCDSRLRKTIHESIMLSRRRHMNGGNQRTGPPSGATSAEGAA